MIAVQLTPYQRRHREAIHSLMFYSRLTHVHLDWYKAAHWLESSNALVHLAWYEGRLVGIMGAAKPLNHTSWLRLVAVDGRYTPLAILQPLWKSIGTQLYQAGVKSVSILLINNWLARHLPDLGFGYLEDVVTMYRGKRLLPPFDPLTESTIRLAYNEDLPEIAMIDQTAFAPPWQLSTDELYQALRLSAICTVAEANGKMIGYQLSTRHHASAHLARLAVLPQTQSRGIGSLLVYDLLRRFLKRGVKSFTVNTQESNLRSQHIYERFEFYRNGFDLPVWQAILQ